MERFGVIYGIIHPETHALCYVGETLDFQTRRLNHLRGLRSGKHSNWKLLRMFKHIFANGHDDFIWTILEHVSEDRLDEVETQWITKLRKEGVDLCNIADGGKGRRGYRNPCSPETRTKISASLTGRKLPESTKEKLRERRHTQEFKDALSVRMKGNTHGTGKVSCLRGTKLSEDHKRHMVEAKQKPGAIARGEKQHLAKLTESDVRAIRQAYVDGEGSRKIGKRFGISPQAAWYIKTGVTWKHVPLMEENNV